jgi:hypothetical protein
MNISLMLWEEITPSRLRLGVISRHKINMSDNRATLEYGMTIS